MVGVTITDARYSLRIMETEWPNCRPDSTQGKAIERLRERTAHWSRGKVRLDELTYNAIQNTLANLAHQTKPKLS